MVFLVVFPAYGFLCTVNFSQVTTEDEGGICIWDLRKIKAPIQELPGHTHWYKAVYYHIHMYTLFDVVAWHYYSDGIFQLKLVTHFMNGSLSGHGLLGVILSMMA